MYNDLLTLKLPRRVMIVAFADDIDLIVYGETLEEVEILATDVKLEMVHHKTKMLYVRNCRVVRQAKILDGEHNIISKHILKYLRMMINDR